MLTNKSIRYEVPNYGLIAVIPAGTEVFPAANLPLLPNGESRYWAEDWENMGSYAESWQRNYGFLIDAADVDATDETLAEDSRMFPGEDMDGDHASALASAGMGTDEDYEHNLIDE
jgi:hypothetical protein